MQILNLEGESQIEEETGKDLEHLIKTNNRQFTSHSVTHGIKKWASNKILDLGVRFTNLFIPLILS